MCECEYLCMNASILCSYFKKGSESVKATSGMHIKYIQNVVGVDVI